MRFPAPFRERAREQEERETNAEISDRRLSFRQSAVYRFANIRECAVSTRSSNALFPSLSAVIGIQTREGAWEEERREGREGSLDHFRLYRVGTAASDGNGQCSCGERDCDTCNDGGDTRSVDAICPRRPLRPFLPATPAPRDRTFGNRSIRRARRSRRSAREPHDCNSAMNNLTLAHVSRMLTNVHESLARIAKKHSARYVEYRDD